MFIASYANTMRGAGLIAASRAMKPHPVQCLQPMPRLGIRLELFPEPLPETPAREIISRVAAWHGLAVEDIIGTEHRRAWSTARRDAVVAVRFSRHHLSMTQIARIFERDHTTVIYQLQNAGVA